MSSPKPVESTEPKVFSYTHRHSDYSPSYYQLRSPSGIRLNLMDCDGDTQAFIAEANAALAENESLKARVNVVESSLAFDLSDDFIRLENLGCTRTQENIGEAPPLWVYRNDRAEKAEADRERIFKLLLWYYARHTCDQGAVPECETCKVVDGLILEGK